MSMSRFISLWTHPDYAPIAVSAGELEAVERRLQTQLPFDYKRAALEFGLPRPTGELLDAICDRQADLAALGDFLGPAEIVEVTEDWRDLGLPEELVAFATDGIGNLFCFSTDPSGASAQPVFLWDHDSKEVRTVASSFADWIEDFCRLQPS
jgi:hypothetical protein